MTTSKLPTAALCVALLTLAGAAGAEQVLLAPRYAPGDTYLLSLETTTDTRTLSKGATPRASSEDVRLRYQAAVVVMEVDGEGRALRERHEQVQLTFQRPEASGSLFRDSAGYEVRRGRDGSVRLFAGEDGEQRVDRKVESIVANVLESQLEYSLLPALLEPGRAVEVGESWPLDPGLARRVLRARGLRVIEFGEPATASLARDPESDEVLVVHYSIPVAWLELSKMPPDARTAESEGRLEGQVRLSGDPRGRSHSSNLAYRMHGAVLKTGVVSSFPWSVEGSTRTAQQSRVLGRVVVSGL